METRIKCFGQQTYTSLDKKELQYLHENKILYESNYHNTNMKYKRFETLLQRVPESRISVHFMVQDLDLIPRWSYEYITLNIESQTDGLGFNTGLFNSCLRSYLLDLYS